MTAPAPAPTLRWGLIGASDIAATRVIPALRARGDEVVSIVSGSADRAQEFKRQHHLAQATTELQVGIADVEAVYISSANHLHADQALAAISAGKHVLCEKPLALTVGQAQELVTAADRVGVQLATNHHLPGSPLHVAVREAVDAGRIGTLLAARVAHAVMLPQRLQGWRLSDSTAGGAILDITCHDASVLLPLFGSLPMAVSAHAAHQGRWPAAAPDAVMTTMSFEGGGLAQTHDSFTNPHTATSLHVLGSEGSIVVTDAMTQDTHGTVEIWTDAGRNLVALDTSTDLYRIVADAFAASIAGTASPTATGQAGADAVRVALAALESARTGTAVDPRALT
ncbi:MAG: Gfo/Idh/MocA family protein [Beutenbergiaceae bacterium]